MNDTAMSSPSGSHPSVPQAEGQADLWVFAYGSLMWRPGFAWVERQPALLRGYHRSFCIFSHHHRGTPERPGLVLGLDRGGACRGLAFRVSAEESDTVRAYLIAREQVTTVYRDLMLPVRLEDGRRVPALAFVADRRHPQYAGRLSLAEQVALVVAAEGVSGRNVDYLDSTVAHLAGMGMLDGPLHALQRAVAAHRTAPAAQAG